MQKRNLIGALAVAAALSATTGSVRAFDDAQYPDLSGAWERTGGAAPRFDTSKPRGLPQQAPLTPEFQKLYEASLADQAAGGQGEDIRITCVSTGLPRMMTAVRPFEFVITPNVTYINSENNQPRRIYTDGRAFPKDEEPTWPGANPSVTITTFSEVGVSCALKGRPFSIGVPIVLK